jgi:hypothetical protein
MNSSLQQAIRLLKLLLKNPGDEDVRALVTAFIAGMEQSERIALGQETPPPPAQNVAERGREILERVAQRGRETAGARIALGPALDLVDGEVIESEAEKRPRDEETRGSEPYGYRWAHSADGKRAELVEEPHEQKCLNEIARLRKERLSYRQICGALNARLSEFYPRNARSWTVSNIRLRLDQLRQEGRLDDRPPTPSFQARSRESV